MGNGLKLGARDRSGLMVRRGSSNCAFASEASMRGTLNSNFLDILSSATLNGGHELLFACPSFISLHLLVTFVPFI